jgi:hypothetical protein
VHATLLAKARWAPSAKPWQQWQRLTFARVRSSVRSPADSAEPCAVSEPRRTETNAAPSRQAGGHWFEPSTAHQNSCKSDVLVVKRDDYVRAMATLTSRRVICFGPESERASRRWRLRARVVRPVYLSSTVCLVDAHLVASAGSNRCGGCLARRVDLVARLCRRGAQCPSAEASAHGLTPSERDAGPAVRPRLHETRSPD